jgi:ABC-type iron transport system FetAB ATPase subunit
MSQLQIKEISCHGVGPLDLLVGTSECVTLSGPSGAGKTLLLRAIADMEPHEGAVFLDNVESRDMNPPQWRKTVGLLPADTQWWRDLVGEHFKEVNEDWLHRLGFDRSVMNWEIRRLSTGERQRLGIVRLLENRPKALLLDEPTANLDTDNRMAVEQLIADYQVQNQSPIIWVTHDPQQIQRISSHHFRVMEGKLVRA